MDVLRIAVIRPCQCLCKVGPIIAAFASALEILVFGRDDPSVVSRRTTVKCIRPSRLVLSVPS